MNHHAEDVRKNDRQLAHYFEYSNHGIEVIEDGLETMTFGEFLVQESVLTRPQLLAALQLQDKKPDKRIGECIAALGYLPYAEVQRFLERWNSLDVVLV